MAKKYQFYPRPVSVYTGKRNLEWRQASGRGTVYTYTISHRAPAPFKKVPPFIVATIELEEGVRIISNVINCPLEEIRVGLPVRVVWHRIDEEFAFPLFEPDR